MNKRNKRSKSLEFKLQLSTPFLVRTRCKHCGSMPFDYFQMHIKRGFLNPRDLIRIKSWFYSDGSVCDNFYIDEEPKSYNVLSPFSYTHQGLSYSPKLHIKNKSFSKNDITDCMVCQCGKTYWYFGQVSSKNKPEVVNRKTQSTFSQKIMYY